MGVAAFLCIFFAVRAGQMPQSLRNKLNDPGGAATYTEKDMEEEKTKTQLILEDPGVRTLSSGRLAKKYNVSKQFVCQLRADANIPSPSSVRVSRHRALASKHPMLGKMPDSHLADMLKVPYHAVRRAREEAGIKVYNSRNALREDPRLGLYPDSRVAELHGASVSSVSAARRSVGIAASRHSRRSDIVAPLLFLDIDGVLNSRDYYTRRDPEKIERFGLVRLTDVDPAAVARLNRLAYKGVVCCLSSSWRKLLPDIDSAVEMFVRLGIRLPLVGMTPKGRRASQDYTRGEDISLWLRCCPQYTNFAIVDDSGDMGRLASRLVQTDHMVGLTDEDVDKLERLLGV